MKQKTGCLKQILLTGAWVAMVVLFQLSIAKPAAAAEPTPVRFGESKNAMLKDSQQCDEYVFMEMDNTLAYYVQVKTAQNLSVRIYDAEGKKLKRGDVTYTQDGDLMYVVEKCKPGKYYVRISTVNDLQKDVNYSIKVTKSNQDGTVKFSKSSATYSGKKRKLPKVRIYDCDGKEIDKNKYTYGFDNRDGKPRYSNRDYAKKMGKYGLYVKYGPEYYYYDENEEKEGIWETSFNIIPERAVITGSTIKGDYITVTCKKSKYTKSYWWEVSTDKEFKQYGRFQRIRDFGEM